MGDRSGSLDGILERFQIGGIDEAPWRQRLRLLQASWREQQGMPVGRYTPPGRAERPLGSLIGAEVAEASLGNFLSDTIRECVRDTLVRAEADGQGALFARPRLFASTLSSQPLCFNLFGELAADRELAGRVLGHLWPGRIDAVTSICFEFSPGRGDERYSGNRAAFDVFVEHTVPGGGAGFVGFEVKYHEDLRGAGEVRTRVEEVAAASGVFRAERLEDLRRSPLQQLWFDHLLALSMLAADGGSWQTGLFVLLHPAANPRCYRVASDYAGALTDTATFDRRSLEEVVGVLRLHTDAQWVEDFRRRYLDYDRLHDLGAPPL